MSTLGHPGPPVSEADEVREWTGDTGREPLLPSRAGVEGQDGDDDDAAWGAPVAPLRKPSRGGIYGLTLLAAISGFMFGYDTGIVSGAMLLIVKDLGLQGRTFEQELIVSITLVGCIIASVGSKPLIEGAGRRVGILVAAATFTGGAAVMWAARLTPTPFETLVVGRFLVGLGVGLASMVTPVYIGEVAPMEIRGKLITLNNVFITGGQFVACVVAGALAKYDYPHGWEMMLGLSGVPSALQFAGMLFAIESPRWLAKYRGRAAALSALARVRPGNARIEDEADEIMASIKEEAQMHAVEFGFFDLFRSRSMRSILLLGAGLQAVQQLSGINTVMYYAGTIVTMAGWTDVSDAIWITAGFSFIGFLCNIAGMLQVEKRGRRFIVLGSLGGVTVALAALGVAFYMLRATSPDARAATPGACEHGTCYDCTADPECGFCGGLCVRGNASAPASAAQCPEGDASYHGSSCPVHGFNWGVVALAATTVYLAFFQAGMGPAPWVINSEIFPLRAKSVGVATTTAVNWSCNLLIAFTFLDLCNAITRYGAFWLYGGIAAAGFAWFAAALPETSGKRLEEIEALFGVVAEDGDRDDDAING